MTDDISTRLAVNLRRLRDDLGLSQQALSERSGVPRPTVAHLESGQANPTLTVVSKLARSLGVTLDGLLEPEEPALRLLEPGELRSERSRHMKRRSLLPEGLAGGLRFERVELKPAGACQLEAPRGASGVVACERGELLLTSSGQSIQLKTERVALTQGVVRCSSASGAVVYHLSGHAR